MQIAFIHSDKKIGTGAHYINDLVSIKMRERKHAVKNFYPRAELIESPNHLRGLANILFFYSLLSKKSEILQYDLVHGTTYTPLPFLAFNIPVVSHFGSTTGGFLEATPLAANMENGCKKVWYELRKHRIIHELNLKTRRPLRDIAEIEAYVAHRARVVITTSKLVKNELIEAGVPDYRIRIVHNAIEDYWFTPERATAPTQNPGIVFLGRLGEDPFTLKLKGLDRLIHAFTKFPASPKHIFCITQHKTLMRWLTTTIPNTITHLNIIKDQLPEKLNKLAGSALFISSRYEGFSLSLIEGMSQGLIPVTYPVGVAPEIIQDGVNGFLVHSQAEATQRIDQVLKLSVEERTRMITAAKKTARQFTSDRMIDQLTSIYNSILRANHS